MKKEANAKYYKSLQGALDAAPKNNSGLGKMKDKY